MAEQKLSIFAPFEKASAILLTALSVR